MPDYISDNGSAFPKVLRNTLTWNLKGRQTFKVRDAGAHYVDFPVGNHTLQYHLFTGDSKMKPILKSEEMLLILSFVMKRIWTNKVNVFQWEEEG